MDVKALKFGDYGACIDGVVVPVAFERKGLGDLYGTMTSGYERFKKEMGRAKEAGAKLVLLVEGTRAKVGNGYKHSRYPGSAMLKKLAMLRVRYDLEYHFCSSREEMAGLISDFFLAIERNYATEKKLETKAKKSKEAET